jgi:hypothetical protein
MGNIIEAPWTLTGNGYIMLFKFPKPFILEHGFLAERFQDCLYGNVGAIIFADYLTSNVGPYQELFFIPGKLHYQHRKLYTISKNFVSDRVGIDSSLNNWGISKELASFQCTSSAKNIDNIKVTQDGISILDIAIKTSQSDLSFPLSTFYHPLPMAQHYEGKNFRFKIHGKSSGKFAQILKVDVNPELFPNFAFFKHVAIIKITNFHIKLPQAKVKKEI